MLTLDIEKKNSSPTGMPAYYVHLKVDSTLGVTCDSALPCSHPNDAIRDAHQKLSASWRVGETIKFGGKLYMTVDESVAAIQASQPKWQ